MGARLDADRPLTLQQLRAFLAVADLQSFSLAAHELGLSQPSISYQVKELEAALGVALLDRMGKRMRLTEAGDVLYDYAQRSLRLIDEAAAAIDHMRGLESGRLRVGASTTVGIYVVPLALGAFKRRHPGISVSLDIGGRAILQDRLLRGVLDVAVLSPPLEHAELAAEPWMDDELVMVVPAGHRLDGRAGLTLRDFESEPFLMREVGSGTREEVEKAVAAAGVRLSVAMELGSNGAIKHAVEAGLGVAVLSRHAITMEARAGSVVVVEVRGLPIRRPWVIAHVRGGQRGLPPAVEAFAGFLRDGRPAAG
ncbi:MAG: LysR family transcriptional regulator [Candidatus Dormibacteraeota bacterium]|nr:LysR family transcriptional regulator [Candidatus Dormibacteraeota bacterium]